MPKYILKRIVGTIPTLIIVVTFVFFFVRLIPGDPARLVAGEQATQDDVCLLYTSSSIFPLFYSSANISTFLCRP